jgi:two-component system sensor histidine kinase SenX3
VSPDVASIMAVLPDAALITNARGRVLHATAAAVEMGLVRDGVLGVEQVETMARECWRTGAVVDAEVSVRRGPHTLTRVDLHLRVAPLSATTVLVIAEDLSDARRVDAVRRDFVANVSHELKTPVGALSLLAEAVQSASDDPESVAHFAGRMQIETARLSALVQDLIDLSRLQGGETVGDFSQVSVSNVLVEAVDATKLLAQRKEIDIIVGGTPGLLVSGDEHLLVTAVRNLINNAINYSPDGTRVAVASREHDGMVEISVTDQGIGIPDAEQERIFERFYRVDPARSRATGGTGLGLAIVKHVCVNHGGEVTVWSRSGEGSTFTLRLPCLAAAVPLVEGVKSA